jgi:hypothetical protein
MTWPVAAMWIVGLTSLSVAVAFLIVWFLPVEDDR